MYEKYNTYNKQTAATKQKRNVSNATNKWMEQNQNDITHE